MRRKGYPINSNSEGAMKIAQKDNLEVYPNPGNVEFSLKILGLNNGDIAVLEIADNQGRILMKQNYQTGQKIVTSDLPAGVYHIAVLCSNHKYNALWVKY
ncbi:MAG: T9SS type A sorting domain-containing protein [Sphingobacteriaceae bacterium]|nr:T9SS type A sorting domain-containing protein [Sphingobacteriaceae bacterium]